MCGRYSVSRDADELAREFEVDRVDVREKLEPDYNVAPSRQVPIIVDRFPGGDEDAKPERRLTRVRWGLVPAWAKDIKVGYKMINARVETAHEKPAYRRPFARRRCLLPADGYYEWYGEVKGKKQPFFIRPRNGAVLAMAGLYEIWRDPSKEEDDPDRFLWTCTVLTTTAEDSVGQIHDRMPLMLEPKKYGDWLDPRVTDVDKVRSLLIPAAPGRLEAYPVSPAVNSVKNNSPDLMAPLPFDRNSLGAL